MVSLVFLGLAIVCALISRILLLIAAINISAGWAFGVFLPFGPLFFRLNYPEAARNSFLFRVATLLCVFGFVISQPRMTLHMPKIHPTAASPRLSKQTVGYAMEKPGTSKKVAGTPTPAPTPTLDQRRSANAIELERLREVEAELKLRKRDLLHSDTEEIASTRLISRLQLRQLAKATAEKNALASAKWLVFAGLGACHAPQSV
jgi:hypothetical protein